MEEKNKESAVNAAAFGGTVTEVSLTLRGVVTALREEAPKHVATIQEKTNGAIVGGKTAAAKATEFVKSI
jgi:hypothetical protein